MKARNPVRVPATLGLALALVLGTAVAAWSQAALTGPEILSRVDAIMAAPQDQDMEATLVLIDKAGARKERTIQMLQKGADKRLARFLSPADQRGIGVLTLPDDVIYLYLPAYDKVKRIASHVKNGSFAGTDFTYEDLQAKPYAPVYDARLLREEQGQYVIELTPKSGQPSDYSRLVMWATRDNFVPMVVEFYDKKGNLGRKLDSRRVEQVSGYWVAREREMLDVASGHRTIMTFTSVKFNTGLADELFSTRTLERR